jgi:hypothetical protein
VSWDSNAWDVSNSVITTLPDLMASGQAPTAQEKKTTEGIFGDLRRFETRVDGRAELGALDCAVVAHLCLVAQGAVEVRGLDETWSPAPRVPEIAALLRGALEQPLDALKGTPAMRMHLDAHSLAPLLVLLGERRLTGWLVVSGPERVGIATMGFGLPLTARSDAMPDVISALVEEGRLSQGHALKARTELELHSCTLADALTKTGSMSDRMAQSIVREARYRAAAELLLTDHGVVHFFPDLEASNDPDELGGLDAIQLLRGVAPLLTDEQHIARLGGLDAQLTSTKTLRGATDDERKVLSLLDGPKALGALLEAHRDPSVALRSLSVLTAARCVSVERPGHEAVAGLRRTLATSSMLKSLGTGTITAERATQVASEVRKQVAQATEALPDDDDVRALRARGEEIAELLATGFGRSAYAETAALGVDPFLPQAQPALIRAHLHRVLLGEAEEGAEELAALTERLRPLYPDDAFFNGARAAARALETTSLRDAEVAVKIADGAPDDPLARVAAARALMAAGERGAARALIAELDDELRLPLEQLLEKNSRGARLRRRGRGALAGLEIFHGLAIGGFTREVRAELEAHLDALRGGEASEQARDAIEAAVRRVLETERELEPGWVNRLRRGLVSDDIYVDFARLLTEADRGGRNLDRIEAVLGAIASPEVPGDPPRDSFEVIRLIRRAVESRASSELDAGQRATAMDRFPEFASRLFEVGSASALLQSSFLTDLASFKRSLGAGLFDPDLLLMAVEFNQAIVDRLAEFDEGLPRELIDKRRQKLAVEIARTFAQAVGDVEREKRAQELSETIAIEFTPVRRDGFRRLVRAAGIAAAVGLAALAYASVTSQHGSKLVDVQDVATYGDFLASGAITSGEGARMFVGQVNPEAWDTLSPDQRTAAAESLRKTLEVQGIVLAQVVDTGTLAILIRGGRVVLVN